MPNARKNFVFVVISLNNHSLNPNNNDPLSKLKCSRWQPINNDCKPSSRQREVERQQQRANSNKLESKQPLDNENASLLQHDQRVWSKMLQMHALQWWLHKDMPPSTKQPSSVSNKRSTPNAKRLSARRPP